MYKLFKSTSRLKTLRGLHEALINEGYFATYSIDKLFDTLQNKFGNRIVLDGKDLLKGRGKSKYGLVYSFDIILSEPTEKDIEYINNKLNLFGYYISQKDINDNKASLSIEPKFPIEITKVLKELKIPRLYHITQKSNLSKIKEIGISPRGTETSFYHPDDRIYLIWSNSIEVILAFKGILAKNKNDKIENFVILVVDFDDNLNYYLDDTTINFDYPYIGCYITKNIHPDKIKILG